jgi:hypothetical protein
VLVRGPFTSYSQWMRLLTRVYRLPLVSAQTPNGSTSLEFDPDGLLACGRPIVDRVEPRRRLAALRPAFDHPVTRAERLPPPGRFALTWLPRDNYPTRTPSVSFLALNRIRPPVRQPPGHHEYH